MELPVSQLCQPPRESRLLREADPTFVRNLKIKMMQDPSAPGATPMAVLCKDVSAIMEFNLKHKSVYKYEVLGGLHTYVAKTQLMDEYPDNPFYKVVTAEVYIGLNDEEALRLAQRHNLNSHFIHKITHRDLVSSKGFYSSVCMFPIICIPRWRHAELDFTGWMGKVSIWKLPSHQLYGESRAKRLSFQRHV